MSEEWGPWIDGTVSPPIGSYIQMDLIDLKGRGDARHEAVVIAVLSNDDVVLSPEIALARLWTIDRYRIRKPRGMAILQALIADLPAKPKVRA